MRKCFTLLLCSTLCIGGIFAQKKDQKSSLYESPNSPIDNVSHWKDMAKRGIIPHYVPIPVKPATVGSSLIQTPKGLQNSPDVLIMDVTGTEQDENSVFVDPNNRDIALNSNNSFGSSSGNGANYVLTIDGGLSWTGSELAAGGADKGDPAACIGLNGRQYIGAINSARKQVVSWSDDGTTWTKVNVVSGTLAYPDLLDKNHLWIDNTNSSNEGYLYNAWTHFETGHTNDGEIEFSRSTDDGLSWSTPINISSNVGAGAHNQGVNINCNNTGWVFAVWIIYDIWDIGDYDEDAIGFARSSNGGASFDPAQRIHSNISGIRSTIPNATGKDMRVNSFPSMAIDNSGGTYHGHQYVVWANVGVPGVNTGTNVSIYMMKSTNGGTVWSTPSRINTVAGDNHAAYFPWITCDPVTGNLFVIFYDDRNFEDDSGDVETWVAYSEDGGASWTDMAVSDVSFTPSPVASGGYMGDYLGISAYDGKVYPTWTDNRSGGTQTYVSPLDFGCSASGGGYEHISNVQFGTINNSSGSDEYADYTNISTNLPLNATPTIAVTNGVTTYPQDQCGIWVDWNRDDDFEDANETISVSNTPSEGPYTAVISPPIGTELGLYKMRIRITYTGAVEPCGRTNYGEVEDYTINVTAHSPNEWIGVFNNYWHNSKNWSLGHIPLPDEDVVIQNAGDQPVYVDDYPLVPNEECQDLTVETGATLEFYDMKLIVNGDASINGEVIMSQNNSYFDILGNILWNANSSLNVTASLSYINVYGDWNFNAGANVNPTLGFVDFRGTSTKYIRCYSSNSSFYNLRVYKSGGAALGLSALSSQDLVVNNLTYLSTSSLFNGFSNQGMLMKGSFNYYGTFDFNAGSVIFDGTNIRQYSSGSGTFNNVIFNSTTGSQMINGDMTVTGDLTIQQGYFSPDTNTVFVAGDWLNNVGTGGFIPGTGRVTFNGGNYHQYCSSETFNELEIDKTLGGAFRMNGANVECAAYDWTAGAIDVLSGSFTANDLLDNAIQGGYYLNTGGTINLTNSGTGLYVDLKGDIHIFGGTMTVTGTISEWPYQEDASIEMSGGLLDFTSCGIIISNNAYALTDNITGGTIRTSVGFSGNRADFTPTAGIFEFYGSADAYLTQSNGCTLNNVVIDKSAKSNDIYQPENPGAKADRIDKTKGDGSKANNITLTSNLVVSNDFSISGGVFNAATFDMYVGGNWINDLGVSGFIPGTGTVFLDGTGDVALSTVGSQNFNNLTVDKGSFGNIVSLTGSLDLTGDFVVNTGALYSYGNNIIVDGNVTVNTSGLLYIMSGSTFGVGVGLQVQSGAYFYAIGTSGNPASVTRNSGGYFSLDIFEGGTIGAQYASFEFVNGSGVYVRQGANVHSTYSFNYCSFSNGPPAPSALLALNSDNVFTCTGAYFENTLGTTGYNVWHFYDTGDVEFIDATGDFAGEDFDYDLHDVVTWTYTSRTLALTVFMEGPFNPGSNQMDTDINGILPLNQPYGPALPYYGNPMPDWYYSGGESVASIPNTTVVDWVLVQLRDATSAATAMPATTFETIPAFVLNTGEIVALDGISPLTFTGTPTNDLFVAIWHRNHLGILSASALVDAGGAYTFDFSSSSGQAHGGSSAQTQLSTTPAIWGLMSGDGNGNGFIGQPDKLNVWNTQAGESGYKAGDFSLDGQIYNQDKNDYWVPNFGASSSIPE